MPGEHWQGHTRRLREEILNIVEQYWSLHEKGPGVTYMTGLLGVSAGTVRSHVKAMLDAGVLETDPVTDTLRIAV